MWRDLLILHKEYAGEGGKKTATGGSIWEEGGGEFAHGGAAGQCCVWRLEWAQGEAVGCRDAESWVTESWPLGAEPLVRRNHETHRTDESIRQEVAWRPGPLNRHWLPNCCRCVCVSSSGERRLRPACQRTSASSTGRRNTKTQKSTTEVHRTWHMTHCSGIISIITSWKRKDSGWNILSIKLNKAMTLICCSQGRCWRHDSHQRFTEILVNVSNTSQLLYTACMYSLHTSMHTSMLLVCSVTMMLKQRPQRPSDRWCALLAEIRHLIYCL